MKMNREQAIAWLTLEGWDSVDCYGACFARNSISGKCMPRNAERFIPMMFGRLSTIATADDTRWEGWDDAGITRVVEELWRRQKVV